MYLILCGADTCILSRMYSQLIPSVPVRIWINQDPDKGKMTPEDAGLMHESWFQQERLSIIAKIISFFFIPHEYAPETQFTQAVVIQKMQCTYSCTLNHGVKSKVHPGVSHAAQNSLPHPAFSYDKACFCLSANNRLYTH